VVIFTDVSGQLIGPILGVEEIKSFGFFNLSSNVGKNYHYSLRNDTEKRFSYLLLGGSLKSRRHNGENSRFSLFIRMCLRTKFPSLFGSWLDKKY